MKFLRKAKGRASISVILILTLIPLLLLGGAFALYYFKGRKKISTKDIASTEKIIDLAFTRKERKMMLDNLRRNLTSYKKIRDISLQNHVSPALLFNPDVSGTIFEKEQKPVTFALDNDVQLPDNQEELAFYPLTKLAPLIKTRRIRLSENSIFNYYR